MGNDKYLAGVGNAMSEEQRLYLASEPDEMGNEEFINQFLDRLLNIYSYERLSGLSKGRLNQELSKVEQDFWILKQRFSQGDAIQEDKSLARIAHGDNFRDLGELTTEQIFEINWTKQIIERNFNQALLDAREQRIQDLGRILGPIQAILGGDITVNVDVTFGGEKN